MSTVFLSSFQVGPSAPAFRLVHQPHAVRWHHDVDARADGAVIVCSAIFNVHYCLTSTEHVELTERNKTEDGSPTDVYKR